MCPGKENKWICLGSFWNCFFSTYELWYNWESECKLTRKCLKHAIHSYFAVLYEPYYSKYCTILSFHIFLNLMIGMSYAIRGAFFSLNCRFNETSERKCILCIYIWTDWAFIYTRNLNYFNCIILIITTRQRLSLAERKIKLHANGSISIHCFWNFGCWQNIF